MRWVRMRFKKIRCNPRARAEAQREEPNKRRSHGKLEVECSLSLPSRSLLVSVRSRIVVAELPLLLPPALHPLIVSWCAPPSRRHGGGARLPHLSPRQATQGAPIRPGSSTSSTGRTSSSSRASSSNLDVARKDSLRHSSPRPRQPRHGLALCSQRALAQRAGSLTRQSASRTWLPAAYLRSE